MHDFVTREEFEGLIDVVSTMALTYVPRDMVRQFAEDLQNLHKTRGTTGKRNEVHLFVALRLEHELDNDQGHMLP